MTEPETIAAFTDLYWNRRAPWTKTFWRGHQVAKCPLDLWVYQEILFETRPDILIETGSSIGGSALFFATMFDLIGRGTVVTVDKDAYPNRPEHPRIEYITGDSVSPEVAARAARWATDMKTMVVLDSLHTYEHVAAELELYGTLVSPGCYLVVEDTGVDESWGKRAAAAALREFLDQHGEFLDQHSDFQVDRSRELHLLTFNPSGWVKRLS